MKKSILILTSVFVFLTLTAEDCSRQAESSSGVAKATAKVTTDLQGRTQEQLNILEKIKRDSEIGKIRHLYIISAYSGEVLEYYTIKGKITSGSKRLNPKTAASSSYGSFMVDNTYYTEEVLSDDGTYGDSNNYFYFFDTSDNYHQVFPTGGTYTRISDRPLTIKKSSLIFQ